jgi:membrane-bound lytic murein transglycosylase B
MQSLLVDLGFDPGKPDGVVGSKTRAALRAFQRQAKMAPDGYPTAELLAGLRQVATARAKTN